MRGYPRTTRRTIWNGKNRFLNSVAPGKAGCSTVVTDLGSGMNDHKKGLKKLSPAHWRMKSWSLPIKTGCCALTLNASSRFAKRRRVVILNQGEDPLRRIRQRTFWNLLPSLAPAWRGSQEPRETGLEEAGTERHWRALRSLARLCIGFGERIEGVGSSACRNP